MFMAMDTSTVSNLIPDDMIPTQWKCDMVHNAPVTQLGDANGNALAIHALVTLFVRFCNDFCSANFLVANGLDGDVIVGTEFMNKYVHDITCRDKKIVLRWGTIPIMAASDET